MSKCNGKCLHDACEPCVERMQGESFTIGQVAGYEEISPRLLVMAGEAFARKQDARAQLLRDLADIFSEEAKKRRKQYETEYTK